MGSPRNTRTTRTGHFVWLATFVIGLCRLLLRGRFGGGLGFGLGPCGRLGARGGFRFGAWLGARRGGNGFALGPRRGLGLLLLRLLGHNLYDANLRESERAAALDPPLSFHQGLNP